MSFEEAVAFYGEFFDPDEQLIKEAIHCTGLEKGSKVLDIGTGWGIMAVNLALIGFDVLTGQPEDKHDEHEGDEHEHYSDWRVSAKELGVENNITFQHFDAQELPFPTESFDGVFLFDALQHIAGKGKALSASIRVAKPKGVVCVIETNQNGVDRTLETEGFVIEYVDPRELLKSSDITTEVIEGKFSNAYLLRKSQPFSVP